MVDAVRIAGERVKRLEMAIEEFLPAGRSSHSCALYRRCGASISWSL
jgi:hypothetical protein